jgi:hypothetical protein
VCARFAHVRTCSCRSSSWFFFLFCYTILAVLFNERTIFFSHNILAQAKFQRNEAWGPQLLQSTVNNGSTGFQLTMIGWFLSDDRAAYVYVRGHIIVAYTSMLWGKETEAKASYVRRPSGRWMEIELHRILLHRPVAISAVRRSRLGTYTYPGDRWQPPRAKARNVHVAPVTTCICM